MLLHGHAVVSVMADVREGGSTHHGDLGWTLATPVICMLLEGCLRWLCNFRFVELLKE